MKYIVLVPYCVRSMQCPMPADKGEFNCLKQECQLYNKQDCGMYSLLATAEEEGLPVRIIRHNMHLARIIREVASDVVLGLACTAKQMRDEKFLASRNIECHSIPLLNGSCVKETGIPSQYPLEQFVALIKEHGPSARR